MPKVRTAVNNALNVTLVALDEAWIRRRLFLPLEVTGELYEVANNSGGMVPLGTLLSVREIVGPDKVMHYNLYPSADINGALLPGVSSGQAIQMMDQICRETHPPQFGFEWT
ncbi:MAG: efflux RND transporter permease subunit, partial [Verrucomicrobia bacterium]|nr:efflux RND transporter permease subunit [Verrucomicrobiota bacterium]